MPESDEPIKCPNCGSDETEVVTENSSSVVIFCGGCEEYSEIEDTEGESDERSA